MRHFIKALIPILFFTHFVHAQSTQKGHCQEQNQETVALIKEYRELRDKRRQSRPGTFDADLDGYRGRLHKVLTSLGEEPGRPPHTKVQLIACLGEPAAVRSEKQMGHLLDVYRREKRAARQKVSGRKGRQYLIYFWRGWHDLLFFVSEGGAIVDHGWWFAYE